MSEAAGGSTLLTSGVGTPTGGQPELPLSGDQGGAPAPNGAAAPNGQAANGQGTPSIARDANGDWRVSFIPEDIRSEPVFSKYNTPQDLARSHVNLERLLGGEKIPKPKSDDDQEGWDRWFKAAGRPDKPDEYAFERPNSLPDNFYDEEAERSFKTWAHVNGLTKKQAANLHDNYVKTRLEQHHAWQTSQKQAVEKAEGELRREWGQQYDAKINAAKSALRAYGDPDYLKYLDESGQGNNPQMTRIFARIGEKMMGERRLQGDPTPESSENVQDLIAAHRTKYNEALHDKRHPDHELRVRQYNALFAKAYPQT
jgi:hypothetical protein